MGYGVIAVHGQAMTLLQYGVIQLSKYSGHELKLKKIFERVIGLIDDFHPDEVALEAPFYGKNIQSMLKLGRPGRGHGCRTFTGDRDYRICP